jgi:hypothetical protein
MKMRVMGVMFHFFLHFTGAGALFVKKDFRKAGFGYEGKKKYDNETKYKKSAACLRFYYFLNHL